MNLIYDIKDKPKTIKEWIVYPLQQVLAVFVATVLIATLCGTPIDACLFGACIGTLVYQVITGFKSPMFISSCGATQSAVFGALATTNDNYLSVAIGGLVILLVYLIIGLLVMKNGEKIFTKLFPPAIVGAITVVIGVYLAGHIFAYTQIQDNHSNIGILIAIFTMFVVAVSSHYFKGFWKTIPFLIGLVAGYLLSLICGVVDFTSFNNVNSVFSLPDFSFLHWNKLTLGQVGQVVIMFLPVALAAVCEHYSDHKVLSNIIGTDLTTKPGLHRTLWGDGVASLIGTITCGLPNTSYGESIATTGFSRVASVAVISVAAGILGLLSFIKPFIAFLQTIPSCVFGGCAMVLYGFIASSGLKTLKTVDLENNKNLIIVSVVLTVGVSGIWLFNEAFKGVSLAMVLGVILNLVLKDENS